jgi:CubicO group peptidase (beta-lactamase class C family)
MKKIIFIFYIIISFTSSAISQYSKKIEQSIQNILNDMDSKKTLGSLAIAVLDNDSVYTYHFGWQNMAGNTRHSIDENSVLSIGGLSKIFTAAILLKLEKSNKIKLNQPVNVYLPQKMNFPLGNKITIAQLLSHTSGLPKFLPKMDAFAEDKINIYKNISDQILIENLSILDTNYLAKGYLNSNINYALLQVILESIEKEKFDNILKKYISDVYSLQNTSLHIPKEKVVGYAENQELTYQDYNIFNGSLGIKSNLNDLVIFFKNEIQIKNNPLLERKVKIDEKNYATLGCYETILKNKKNIYSQLGITNGYSSIWMHNPSTKTAVIILSNTKVNLNELAFLILQYINTNWKRKS